MVVFILQQELYELFEVYVCIQNTIYARAHSTSTRDMYVNAQKHVYLHAEKLHNDASPYACIHINVCIHTYKQTYIDGASKRVSGNPHSRTWVFSYCSYALNSLSRSRDFSFLLHSFIWLYTICSFVTVFSVADHLLFSTPICI